MTLDDLVAYARECGLANTAWLRQLARRTVALTPDDSAGTASRGSTLGGRPTLPPGVMWPRHDGHSLAFIARIDLAEQPRSLAEQGFPAEGLLLFFYDAEQRTWGFDPKDAGTFAVIYVPDSSTATTPAEWPPDLPEHARYPSCELAGHEVWVLPPWESVLIDDLQLAPEQLEAYQNLLERISDDDPWTSRALLGGYPDQIQGDMMLESALVSSGLYCGDSSGYSDPRVPQLRVTAREWRLLLQVPSADAAGMIWGDVGCLYYWIRDDDLKGRRFDHAWMIVQCS